MSNTMSQDQQFQQNNFPQNNFNPSAPQGNYYFNSNAPSESNPFDSSFQGQAYVQAGNQIPLQNNPNDNSNNNRVDPAAPKNNFTRSSTQEPSESGRDIDNDKDEDSETRRQRFLERNRIAASKCRQKKKVWMQQLSSEADQAAARNKALQMMVNQLKDEVLVLKNQLLAHRNCNCNVIQQYIQTSGQFAAMNSQQPPNVPMNTDPNHVSLLPPSSGGSLNNINNLPPRHN